MENLPTPGRREMWGERVVLCNRPDASCSGRGRDSGESTGVTLGFFPGEEAGVEGSSGRAVPGRVRGPQVPSGGQEPQRMGWMVRPRLRPGAQRSEGRTVETLKMKQQEQQAWLFVAEHMLVTEEESRPGAGQGGGSQNRGRGRGGRLPREISGSALDHTNRWLRQRGSPETSPAPFVISYCGGISSRGSRTPGSVSGTVTAA